jgi:hypothetical protein
MSRFHRLRTGEPAPVKAKGVVHQQVADLAKEFAGMVYEEAAHDDDFYRRYPDINAFIRKRWTSFIQPAREQLSAMLGMPDSVVSPHMKAEIYQALLLNAASNPAANLVDDVIEGRVH